jgi:hypothetical protein
MKMKVVVGQPPNFKEIAAVMPTDGAIFCYGDTIYSPQGGRLPSTLHAHEAVHSKRQGTTNESIQAWWDQYLKDPIFRLNEEVLAHQAEYAEFCRLNAKKGDRFHFLVNTAIRLSGPLYGTLVTFAEAKKLVRG